MDKVTNGLNLNGKLLPALIDFNMIVDTDFGLIKLIQERYPDERAFKLDILNRSDNELVELLYSRYNKNPLSIISTEDNLENIDDLYESFMSSCKMDVLEKSRIQKNVDTFVTALGEHSRDFGADPYIAISGEEEWKIVTKKYQGYGFISKRDKYNILEKYPLYVKDYTLFTDLQIEDIIRNKRIYIMPYNYSLSYLKTANNSLSNDNEFVIFGTDYRKKEEESNATGNR